MSPPVLFLSAAGVACVASFATTWLMRGLIRRARDRELRRLLLEEYGYWREQDELPETAPEDELLLDHAVRMGAMGAVSNVLAALTTGVSPRRGRAAAEQRKAGQPR